MAKKSNYQQRVIGDFYKNREALSLQRLSEQVTELYLASGKEREKIWQKIITALKHLDLKPERIEHLHKKDKPELLAKLVEELMAKK